MYECLESFEFIDVSNLKPEPDDDDNVLQEDPLAPNDADVEFIKKEIMHCNEKLPVKVEPVKNEIEGGSQDLLPQPTHITLQDLLSSSKTDNKDDKKSILKNEPITLKTLLSSNTTEEDRNSVGNRDSFTQTEQIIMETLFGSNKTEAIRKEELQQDPLVSSDSDVEYISTTENIKVNPEPISIQNKELQQDPLVSSDSDVEYISTTEKRKVNPKPISIKNRVGNRDSFTQTEQIIMETIFGSNKTEAKRKEVGYREDPLQTEQITLRTLLNSSKTEARGKEITRKKRTRLEGLSSLCTPGKKRPRNTDERNAQLQSAQVTTDHGESSLGSKTVGKTSDDKDDDLSILRAVLMSCFKKQFEEFQDLTSQRSNTSNFMDANKVQLVNSSESGTVIEPSYRTDSFTESRTEPLTKTHGLTRCIQSSNEASVRMTLHEKSSTESSDAVVVTSTNKIDNGENIFANSLHETSSSKSGEIDSKVTDFIVLDETSSSDSCEEVDYYPPLPKISYNEVSLQRNKTLNFNAFSKILPNELNRINGKSMYETLTKHTSVIQKCESSFKVVDCKSLSETSVTEMNQNNIEETECTDLNKSSSNKLNYIGSNEFNFVNLSETPDSELRRSSLDLIVLDETSSSESSIINNDEIDSCTLPDTMSSELTSNDTQRSEFNTMQDLTPSKLGNSTIQDVFCISSKELASVELNKTTETELPINAVQELSGELVKETEDIQSRSVANLNESNNVGICEAGQSNSSQEPCAVKNSNNEGLKNKQLIYSCKYCNFYSEKQSSLQGHTTRIHGTNKVKKCPKCPEVFEDMFSLRCHFLADHRGNTLHCCEYCEHVTFRKGDMKHHVIAVHGGDKPFLCSHCSRTFSRKGDMKNHIERKHVVFECSQCDKTGSRKFIKLHVNMVHKKEQCFKCPQCQFISSCKSSLNSHINSVHSLYTCEYCGKEFGAKAALDFHVRAFHFNQTLFKCTDCDYSTISHRTLRDHIMGKHHGLTRKHACPHCSYRAHLKSSLTNHVKAIHNTEKRYKCSYCDQAFRLKTILSKHLITDHVGEEIFSCLRCDFKTTTKDQLDTHHKDHHNIIKLYQCTDCEFESRSVLVRRQHMLTEHAKGLVYNCPHCDYKANKKTRINKHVRVRHADVADSLTIVV